MMICDDAKTEIYEIYKNLKVFVRHFMISQFLLRAHCQVYTSNSAIVHLNICNIKRDRRMLPHTVENK